MLFFRNDYGEGAHPDILAALSKTNGLSTAGYGEDAITGGARELILRECKAPEAKVYFVPGGTQANLLAISSALRPHEAVLTAATGHINVHETGAIEATGHKVLSMEAENGKVSIAALSRVLAEHTDHHMVKPRMLYISNATELGTVYTKAELSELHTFLRREKLLLFLDGARLGAALAAKENDLTLPDLARMCDVFTIGGTKNGLLFGEAIVIVNPALQADFPYHIKQRGALLAKGRLLGVQFAQLFADGLFMRIAQHENAMADRLAKGLLALGIELLAPPATNQLFPILKAGQVEKLRSVCAFEVIEPREHDTVIRFVTSWATREEDVDQLLNACAKL